MQSIHLEWAIKELNKIGYEIHSPTPDIIQKTEWSTVYRFKTNQGFIFFKKVPPSLSIEPKIINILSQFNAPVPSLLAVNDKLHCFLMQDAGVPLHQAFKNNFKMDVFIQMMNDYSALQINTTDKIDLFLEIGVPDWRLKKLPKLYDELIAEEELLIGDGLSKDDLIILKNNSSAFASICEKLSSYNIKDTFCHADFHDKNILIDNNFLQTTIIDLGEVVITYPFFSFLNCIHMANENFSLSESQYEKLKLECFKPWLEFETQEHLYEILNMIQQCWSIHAALGEWRLIKSVEPVDSSKLLKQKRLSTKLRFWINHNKGTGY